MLNKVQVLIIFIRRTVNTCLLSLVLLSKGLEEAIITLSLWRISNYCIYYFIILAKH